MCIGLTFDEYVDVRLRPPTGADSADPSVAEFQNSLAVPTALAWISEIGGMSFPERRVNA